MDHVFDSGLKTNRSVRTDVAREMELKIDPEDSDFEINLGREEEWIFWYSVIYSIGSCMIEAANSKKACCVETPDHCSQDLNGAPLINKLKDSKKRYSGKHKEYFSLGDGKEQGEGVTDEHVVRCLFCGYWVLYMIAVAAENNKW